MLWVTVTEPQLSRARKKFVPVTSGIKAWQLVLATNTWLVKVYKMTGGVMSVAVRATALEVMLPEIFVTTQQ